MKLYNKLLPAIALPLFTLSVAGCSCDLSEPIPTIKVITIKKQVRPKRNPTLMIEHHVDLSSIPIQHQNKNDMPNTTKTYHFRMDAFDQLTALKHILSAQQLNLTTSSKAHKNIIQYFESGKSLSFSGDVQSLLNNFCDKTNTSWRYIKHQKQIQIYYYEHRQLIIPPNMLPTIKAELNNEGYLIHQHQNFYQVVAPPSVLTTLLKTLATGEE